MDSVYFLTGASGRLGSQIADCLRDRDIRVVPIISADILSVRSGNLVGDWLRDQFHSQLSNKELRGVVSLILAHRPREGQIHKAIADELRMTRDLVWGFSEVCTEVRVIVMGSVTGRFVDFRSLESYHYCKDLQKSTVRLSVSLPNVFMNLIELSWFRKHPQCSSDPSYVAVLDEARGVVPTKHVVTVSEIVDLACALLDTARPPRGQVITFDEGYSLIQQA
jgi:hypothetical protein